MKKYFVLILCLICVCFTSCGTKPSDGIDVNLSAMNSLMATAEFQKLTASPTDYVGKTIKISGLYDPRYSEQTKTLYHYVVLEAAAECCPHEMEFYWIGNHKYPNDYPAKQQKIEIVGVYGPHKILGQNYYRLSIDDITVLS